jgi:hypothetical protein
MGLTITTAHQWLLLLFAYIRFFAAIMVCITIN